MSKDKKQVMAIAIMPRLKDEVSKFSKRKGLSASEYIGNILEQAVRLNIDDDPIVIGKPIDEEITQVILKVPVRLRSDPEQLKKWISVQMGGIYKSMIKVKEVAQEQVVSEQVNK